MAGRRIFEYSRRTLCLAALLLFSGALKSGRADDTLQLKLQRAVFLQSDGALNLSGLAASADGWLYFSDDRGPSPPDWRLENPVILRVRLDSVLDLAVAAPVLQALEQFTGQGLFAHFADSLGKQNKFDLEGLTLGPAKSLWAVDERDRLLLSFDLAAGTLSYVAGPEVLFKGQEDLISGRLNFGFEGIALLGDRLFLAHEMSPTLIVSYGLGKELEPGHRINIQDCPDLNGLEADKGRLYVLSRTLSLIYKINPETGAVLAVADFHETADSARYRYINREDFFRNSEGLALKGGHIFIVLDGNGQPLLENPEERRPLLLVFRRPENF